MNGAQRLELLSMAICERPTDGTPIVFFCTADNVSTVIQKFHDGEDSSPTIYKLANKVIIANKMTGT